jgi:hypothetical protein
MQQYHKYAKRQLTKSMKSTGAKQQYHKKAKSLTTKSMRAAKEQYCKTAKKSMDFNNTQHTTQTTQHTRPKIQDTTQTPPHTRHKTHDTRHKTQDTRHKTQGYVCIALSVFLWSLRLSYFALLVTRYKLEADNARLLL